MSLPHFELAESNHQRVAQSSSLKVVGLFAGIGGIEVGLHGAGHKSCLLCEVEPAAQRVLARRFPDVDLVADIRQLNSLPEEADLIAAGFPCQDLSQAGKTKGIRGENSGLVDNVFRLLGESHRPPRWLLIENVPFMLQLDRGQAMRHLTQSLESLGFRWAYRVVDARCFGIPQRRRRVILLASQEADPRDVLFGMDSGPSNDVNDDASAYGFYWTEGTRGLGWAVEAVPTLKGGSTIGIPSPPAIWLPHQNRIVTPDIRDAERLQGFRAGWTSDALVTGVREGARWKLVGNAVCVPVARWIGEQLSCPRPFNKELQIPHDRMSAWPQAAWGERGTTYRVEISEWPIRRKAKPLADFLRFPPKPLSHRAAAGFLSRARASSLRFHEGFLDAVEDHVQAMGGAPDA
jgi:DNA (cytosine-5)-methyltransferase 1